MLLEVFNVSKAMIILNSTYRIKPHKLYLNDANLLENYKGLHHPVISVCQHTLPKNYKHVLIVHVYGAVFFIII